MNNAINTPIVPNNDYSARVEMLDVSHEDPKQILNDFSDECKQEFGILWTFDQHALYHISNHPRTNKIFSLKIDGRSCMFCAGTFMGNALENCKPEDASQIAMNIYKNNQSLFRDYEFVSDFFDFAGRDHIENSKAIWIKFKNEYFDGNIEEEAFDQIKTVCYNAVPWDEEDAYLFK